MDKEILKTCVKYIRTAAQYLNVKADKGPMTKTEMRNLAKDLRTVADYLNSES